jgi:hypothetical protein
MREADRACVRQKRSRARAKELSSFRGPPMAHFADSDSLTKEKTHSFRLLALFSSLAALSALPCLAPTSLKSR